MKTTQNVIVVKISLWLRIMNWLSLTRLRSGNAITELKSWMVEKCSVETNWNCWIFILADQQKNWYFWQSQSIVRFTARLLCKRWRKNNYQKTAKRGQNQFFNIRKLANLSKNGNHYAKFRDNVELIKVTSQVVAEVVANPQAALSGASNNQNSQKW